MKSRINRRFRVIRIKRQVKMTGGVTVTNMGEYRIVQKLYPDIFQDDESPKNSKRLIQDQERKTPINKTISKNYRITIKNNFFSNVNNTDKNTQRRNVGHWLGTGQNRDQSTEFNNLKTIKHNISLKEFGDIRKYISADVL